MFEVEVKVKVKDLEQLRDFLLKNCEVGPRFRNIDLYLNPIDTTRDFAKSDEALRVRITEYLDSSGNKTSSIADLTYKGPKIDAQMKTRIEHVVNFIPDDLNSLEKLLFCLGYQKVIVISKIREKYETHYEGRLVEILIDKIEHLEGHYLELEIQSETKSDLESSKQVIIKYLEKLGYSIDNSIRESYLELVLKVLQTEGKQ